MAQLFTRQHYDAFTLPKPLEDSDQERRERIAVKEQFLWLDSALAPFIASKKWDLHRHHQKQHYTSSTNFVWINELGDVDDHEGSVGRWQPIVKEIGWLWLHYGKSKEQLNVYNNLSECRVNRSSDGTDYSNAFYVHARIQLYVTNDYFGVWLLYTDKNKIDKPEFLSQLRKDPAFASEYWKRLQPILDKGFCYVVDDVELPLVTGLDMKRLIDFIKASRLHVGYSGVRKIYKPEDSQLSVENIVVEMRDNLVMLYPLYDMMSYRQKVQKAGIDVSKLFGGNVRVKK